MSLESKPVNPESLRAAAKSSAAYGRLMALFDEGSMSEFDALALSEGKLAEVITACGTVNGINVCAFAQNNEVAGGAVSKASAAKICRLYDFALKTGAAVVGIFDSTGARLKQGAEMLNAYGDMLARSNNLSGVVPQISVIAGSCVGTCALLAAGADIVICTEKADYGIDTTGTDTSAASAVKNGVAQITVKDAAAAIQSARDILALLPQNNLSACGTCEYTDPAAYPLDAAAQKAAAGEDFTADAIAGTVDLNSFIELEKGFGTGVVTGLATIGGQAAGIVATTSKNNEPLSRDAASKVARFVRFCDAFSIPVVTFVDTVGFASIREASMVTHAYAEATTTQITVIAGAAYGAAYVAMAGTSAGADYVVAWPTAVIAPLAPETVSAVLYNDQLKGCKDQHAKRAELVAEYKSTLASPYTAAQAGSIQDVIAPQETRSVILAVMSMLAGKRVQRSAKKHSNIQL